MSTEQLQAYVKADDPQGLSLLINPFRALAGAPALLVGLGVVALTSAIGLTGVAYDGALDLHVLPQALPAWMLAALPVLDWLVVALVFALAGKIVSRSRQRLLDYFAMTALGRAPLAVAGILLLPAFLGKYMTELNRLAATDPLAVTQHLGALPGLPWLALGGLVLILLLIWTGFLNYAALKEASGLKGPLAVVTFFGAALIAEILSKILILGVLLPLR